MLESRLHSHSSMYRKHTSRRNPLLPLPRRLVTSSTHSTISGASENVNRLCASWQLPLPVSGLFTAASTLTKFISRLAAEFADSRLRLDVLR